MHSVLTKSWTNAGATATVTIATITRHLTSRVTQQSVERPQESVFNLEATDALQYASQISLMFIFSTNGCNYVQLLAGERPERLPATRLKTHPHTRNMCAHMHRTTDLSSTNTPVVQQSRSNTPFDFTKAVKKWGAFPSRHSHLPASSLSMDTTKERNAFLNTGRSTYCRRRERERTTMGCGLTTARVAQGLCAWEEHLRLIVDACTLASL